MVLNSNNMSGRDSFSPGDSRNLSFMAADALGSNSTTPGNNIDYERKGGFFVPKLHAILMTILVVILLVVAVFLGRCTVEREIIQQNISFREGRNTTMEEESKGGKKNEILYNSNHPIETIANKIYLRQLNDFTFDGNCTITLHSKTPITNFTINAQNLKIFLNSFQLTHHNTTQEEEKSNFGLSLESYDEKYGSLKLISHETLDPSKYYDLFVEFSGNLNEFPFGLFRMSYNDTNASIRWITVTNMSPNHARAVFPCFDESDEKSIFQLNIARPNYMTCVSSTDFKHEISREGDIVWDEFKPTFKISPDLLSFVISEYYPKNEITVSGSRFAIWSPIQDNDQLIFASKLGSNLLQFYNSYFGDKLKIGKVDVFAVPEYMNRIQSMAVAVIGNEMVKDTNGEKWKESVVKLIAEIITRQWIMHVSVKESDWLDGFISYFKYIGIENVNPDWNVTENMSSVNMHSSLHINTLEPEITNALKKVWEKPIDEMQDATIQFEPPQFNKNAFLLLMLRELLTEETFKASITSFFENSREKESVTINDLWDIMTENMSKNATTNEKRISIHNFMDSWTNVDEYPLIDVTRDYNSGQIHIHQRNFLRNSEIKLRYIPMKFVMQDDFPNTHGIIWLEGEAGKTLEPIPGLGEESWILIDNRQSGGFYRVNYDVQNWKNIQKSYTADYFSPIIRAQLLDDSFELAKNNYILHEIPLSFTKQLKNETHYAVWKTAFEKFKQIDALMFNSPDYWIFAKYVGGLLSSIYDNLFEMEKPGHVDILLKSEIFDWSCRMNVTESILTARKEFTNWINSTENINPIDVNLRGPIYCCVLSHDDTDENYQRLLKLYYETPSSSSEKLLLLRALLCYESDTALFSLLNEMMFVKEDVSNYDISTLWLAIGQYYTNSEYPFQYVRDNWTNIYNRFSKHDNILRYIIYGSTRNLKTAANWNDLSKLKSSNGDTKRFDDIFNSAMKLTELNANWVKQYQTYIISWINSNTQE